MVESAVALGELLRRIVQGEAVAGQMQLDEPFEQVNFSTDLADEIVIDQIRQAIKDYYSLCFSVRYVFENLIMFAKPDYKYRERHMYITAIIMVVNGGISVTIKAGI